MAKAHSRDSVDIDPSVHQVEDIRAAVVFLREEQHIDPFAIVGHRRVISLGLVVHPMWMCIGDLHATKTCAARSKGGTDVILYSQKYDGDPAVIINVCGRFDLASGITARFGEDIYDRLKWEPAITMPHPNNNGPDWRLTDEARLHPPQRCIFMPLRCPTSTAIQLACAGLAALQPRSRSAEELPVHDTRRTCRRG